MVQRRRPPSIPSQIDEYDGHANYRDRIREVASFKPLLWLGVLIAFGMWYAVGKLALVALDPGPARDGVLAILAYVIFGTVGCFAYLVALGFASSKHAQRGMLAGGVLLIAFAAFYPFARDHRLAVAPKVAGDAAALERWIDELRTSGRVAEPGVVPPLVEVQERDGAVLVRNIAGRPLVVQLARVQRQWTEGRAYAWQRCELSNGFGAEEGTGYWLPPHVSAWFRPNGFCGERFQYAEIEYRIGDERSPPALSWRSTSALGPTVE